jgi:hypothetical protein
MKKKESENTLTKEMRVLLTFLKLTKEGKYALIEESSLPYARTEEQPGVLCEDQYIYSIY